MKFRPLHNRVVRRRVEQEGKTTGGILSGTEIKLDGEDFLIMKESDIMAVVDTMGITKKKAA
jgi:chaperonin GroES